MAYCLACGRSTTETIGGFCRQCAVDFKSAKPKRKKQGRYANGSARFAHGSKTKAGHAIFAAAQSTTRSRLAIP